MLGHFPISAAPISGLSPAKKGLEDEAAWLAAPWPPRWTGLAFADDDVHGMAGVTEEDGGPLAGGWATPFAPGPALSPLWADEDAHIIVITLNPPPAFTWNPPARELTWSVPAH